MQMENISTMKLPAKMLKMFSPRENDLGIQGKVINNGFLALTFTQGLCALNLRGTVWCEGREEDSKATVPGSMFQFYHSTAV